MITDLATLSTSPVLVPNATGNGVYVLIKPRSARVFLRFTEFARELSEQLDNQASVKALQVLGKFSDDDATMTIRGMRITLR